MNNEKGFWNKANVILSILASLCAIAGISIWGDVGIIDTIKGMLSNQETESLYVDETTVPNTGEETTPETNTKLEKETTEEVKTLTIQTQPSIQQNPPIEPSYAPTYTVGWLQDEAGNWKWRYEDGSFLYAGWLPYKGESYYFINELMVTGWQQIDGNWYYFNGSGAMQTNTWEGNCYLGADGKMLTNMEINIDGIDYHIDSDGFASPIKNEEVLSSLSFSDDCYVDIDEEYAEFYFVGEISSDYEIKRITYEYFTPNTFLDYPYNGYIDTFPVSENAFDLSMFDYIINSLESNFEDSGDYQLTIFVEDSSGNSISKVLDWYY